MPGVVFVTGNMRGGSNNDDFNPAPWTAEKSQRTDADIRWLKAAVTGAANNRDKAVAVA